MRKFGTLILMLIVFWGEVNAMEKNALSQRQEKIAVIAVYTAQGKLPELQKALVSGLENGLSINEIKEELIQLYAYCGFPRSLNALDAFMKVLDERKAKGIVDKEGKMPKMLAKDKSKYEIGRENYSVLFGNPDSKPKARYEIFAPGIEVFLKEHLFADIFARGVLSFEDREIATVSALSVMPGTAPQLQGHLKGAMAVGLSYKEVEELIALTGKLSAEKEAVMAREVLKKVLNAKEEK